MPLLCRRSFLQNATGNYFWEGEESDDTQVRIQALRAFYLLRSTVKEIDRSEETIVLKSIRKRSRKNKKQLRRIQRGRKVSDPKFRKQTTETAGVLRKHIPAFLCIYIRTVAHSIRIKRNGCL